MRTGGRGSAMQSRACAEEMVKDLKEKVFPAKEVHFLAMNKDGKQVRTI
mgnify:CR=1 FL=1